MLGLEIESFVGSVTAPTRRGFRRFVALAPFAAKEVVSAKRISAGRRASQLVSKFGNNFYALQAFA